MDEGHEYCRTRVVAALSGTSTRPEDVLVRWMFEKDINPNSVFADLGPASRFSTYEGITSVLDLIHYSLVDDGDIGFVVCKSANPMITFLDVHDDRFKEAFMNTIRRSGHGEDALSMYEPVGLLDDVSSYIKAYEEHEAKRSLRINEFMAHRESSGPET